MTLYVNGVQAGTVNIAAVGDVLGTQNFHLSRSAVGGNNLNGTLDEVAVYEYLLSPEQIARHYQAGRHAFTIESPVSPAYTPEVV